MHPPTHHHHLSLNLEGRWGTTDVFATSSFHCPLGLGELQACPFPDAVFPSLPLSALSSAPFHRALQDGFGQYVRTHLFMPLSVPSRSSQLVSVSLFLLTVCLFVPYLLGLLFDSFYDDSPVL